MFLAMICLSPMVIAGAVLHCAKTKVIWRFLFVGFLWLAGVAVSTIIGAAQAYDRNYHPAPSGRYDVAGFVWIWVICALLFVWFVFGNTTHSSRRILLYSLSFCVLLGLFEYLPATGLALTFSAHFPKWSWLHGSREMQQVAGPELCRRILPGSSVEQIIEVLREPPHPLERKRPVPVNGATCFNAYQDESAGIWLVWKDRHVASAAFYRDREELKKLREPGPVK